MIKIMLAIVMALSVGAVNAATLIGESTVPTFTGFSIEFDDIDNDQLLDFGEITAFSGWTFLPGTGSATTYSTVELIPGLPGLTDDSGTTWVFGAGSGPFAGAVPSFDNGSGNFNYRLSGLATVPLPAAGWMLLAGVGALLAAGSRRT